MIDQLSNPLGETLFDKSDKFRQKFEGRNPEQWIQIKADRDVKGDNLRCPAIQSDEYVFFFFYPRRKIPVKIHPL